MICPFATWRPISANISARPGRKSMIRGYTPHTQVGNGSLFGFFNNPATQASSDFWIAKAGGIEQYVDIDAANPWSQGSGSRYYVSVENEGQPDEPFTPEQIDSNARLVAWLISEGCAVALEVHEDKAASGLVPHYAWFDENGHTCPGPGPRFAQFTDIVTAAGGYLHPTQPDPQPIPDLEDLMAALTPKQAENVHDALVLLGVKAAYEMRRGPGNLDPAQLTTAKAISAGDESFAQLEQALHDEKG